MSQLIFNPRIFATGLFGFIILHVGWFIITPVSVSAPAASSLVYYLAFTPWALALLRRDVATFAALAAAVPFIILKPTPYTIAAFGLAALEIRKPLGVVSYLLSIAYAAVSYGTFTVLTAMALAAASTLVMDQRNRGVLFTAPAILGGMWPDLDWGLQWQYIAAGIAGAAILKDRRLMILPLSISALGALSYFLLIEGVMYPSYPPGYSEFYAIPTWLAWLAKAAFAVALIWDGRHSMKTLLGATLASAGVVLLPTPAVEIYYMAESGIAHSFFVWAAIVYTFKGIKPSAKSNINQRGGSEGAYP